MSEAESKGKQESKREEEEEFEEPPTEEPKELVDCDWFVSTTGKVIIEKPYKPSPGGTERAYAITITEGFRSHQTTIEEERRECLQIGEDEYLLDRRCCRFWPKGKVWAEYTAVTK